MSGLHKIQFGCKSLLLLLLLLLLCEITEQCHHETLQGNST